MEAEVRYPGLKNRSGERLVVETVLLLLKMYLQRNKLFGKEIKILSGFPSDKFLY